MMYLSVLSAVVVSILICLHMLQRVKVPMASVGKGSFQEPLKFNFVLET